jgi:spore coat protein E
MADIDGKIEKEVVTTVKPAYREIITKAVCGSGKQDFSYTEYLQVPAERVPSSILGSSVTRLKLTEPLVTEITGDGKRNVRISGTFDINIWYSYNSDQATDVAKETVKFTEAIAITEISEGIVGPVDARAVLTKAPYCLKTVVADGNRLKVDVELGMYAEIIGETKVYVQVYETSE